MSINRYAKKRDANEQGIIRHMEALGAFVWRHDLGHDLLVGYRGKLHIMEIKAKVPKTLPRTTSLTDQEAKCYNGFTAKGVPYHIVTTAQEAQEILLNDGPVS